MNYRSNGIPFSLDEYIQRMASDLLMVSSKDLPDFFILSPPRTGTTWLANALREHPHIYIPQEKELRYFDVGWRFSAITYYTSRYAASKGRLKGDASPTYVLLPEQVIRLLRQAKPDLKCIVILRDLDDRAWSNFRHSYAIGEFGLNRKRLVTGQGLDEVACHYLVSDYCTSVGDYEEYLRRWGRYFPRNQFLILKLNEIVRDPGRVIEQVCMFLEIPRRAFLTAKLSDKVNVGVRIRAGAVVNELLETLYRARHARQQSFFRETFGIEVEDHFPTRNETDRPYELVNRADGYKVIIWKGRFYACQLEDFPAMAHALHDENGVAVKYLTANHWSELNRKIEDCKQGRVGKPTDQQFETDRLVGVLNTLAMDYPRSNEIRVSPAGPRIVQEHKGFNLVSAEDIVIGLRQSLGPVDLAAEGPEGLLAKYGTRNVVVAGSVGEAVYAIDMLDDHEIADRRVEELGRLQEELVRRLAAVGERLEEQAGQLRVLQADRRVEELGRLQEELVRRLAELKNRVQVLEDRWIIRLAARIARIFQ